MDWFHENSEQGKAHQRVIDSEPHKAKLSHEVIAGAAAYEAAKAYENHVRAHGKPPSHEKAKEIFAGLMGVVVDRLVETKGLTYLDKERVKRHASDLAEDKLQSQYA